MIFKIPYSFLKTIFLNITWVDLEFGLRKCWLLQSAAIDHALELLGNGNEEMDVTMLAISDVEEPILEKVAVLAQKETGESKEELNGKWLILLLAWVYENRTTLSNPFDVIEEIYTEFDYPKELSFLIRYMPSNEPDLGSKEANEERMIKKLGRYIECRKSKNSTSGV